MGPDEDELWQGSFDAPNADKVYVRIIACTKMDIQIVPFFSVEPIFLIHNFCNVNLLTSRTNMFVLFHKQIIMICFHRYISTFR